MITYTFDYVWLKVQTNKILQNIFKWTATSLICTAAIIITIWPQGALLPHPFIIFLIGHTIWTIFAFLMKDWALTALNLFFICLDTVGVIIRMSTTLG